MDFSWAQKYPEIYKICTLFQFVEISNPVKYNYKAMQCYLQEGPQCGLVALAMIKSASIAEDILQLYNYAKERQYTNNGEIFSVDYMSNLAKYYLTQPVYIEIFEGYLCCTKLKEFLLGGGIALIPYDTDKDNSPGLHKGHKAHWAVICGSIQTEDDFFVIARHGKAKNIAIWNLKVLAQSNSQLMEFSPDRKAQNLEYKLPEGGIGGPLGLNKRCVLIKF